tara:strand:- start:399 stop:1172 length:774 start_codon:yes stop_codon:yes gene_type:complete
MNIISKVLLPLFLTFSIHLLADDHIPQNPTFVPLEIQQCNFKDNKDMDDFMSHIDEWNNFLDKHSEHPYSGWVLSPHYRTASDYSFDFGWLGVSDSWSNYGKIYDAWLSEARKLGAKFDKVRSCETQTLFAATAIRSAQISSETGTGVLLVSNCQLNEGSTLMDLAEADAKWNNYLDSIDNKGGIYRWFPGLGAASNIDYSFKNVLVSSSMSEWGEGSDTFVNGGGLQTQTAIYGNIVSCDSARMYQSQNVRYVGGL